MAENKKRFSFDDTEEMEIDKQELDDNQEKTSSADDFVGEGRTIINEKLIFDKKTIPTIDDEDTTLTNDRYEEYDEYDGDDDMPKPKKKMKLKIWHIALLVLLSAIIVFVIYVFTSTQNDGPVYGDRCASMLTLENSKFVEVEAKVKEDPTITDIKFEAECRILKVTITFVDNTASATAEALAATALHTFDDSMGQPKEEGAIYSQLFGTANGRGQYDVDFYLKSNGDSDFPIFGTKHHSSDTISFTGANPANQETTDRVLAPEEVAQ